MHERAEAAKASLSGKSARAPVGRLQHVRGKLLAALALPPMLLSAVPFGSQDPLWACIWAVFLSSAAVLFLSYRFHGHERIIIALFAAVWIGLALVYAVHDGYLALAPHPVWRGPSDILAMDVKPLHGVSARHSAVELVFIALPMFSFLAGLGLARSQWRTRKVLVAGLYAGAGLATGWIFLFLISPDTVLWREKLGHHGNLTGTFTNRNTAAAYLALFFVTGVLLSSDFIARHNLAHGATTGAILRKLFRHMPRQLLYRLIATLILLLAILMTASRAGLATALVGASLVLVLRLRTFSPSPRRMLLPVLATLAAFLTLAAVFGQGIHQRFSESESVDEDRFEAYRASMEIIRNFPWFGTGPGTFSDVFPAFRPATMPARGVWEHAHNTYLQVAIEAGVPFLVVVLLPIFFVLVVFAKGSFRGKSDEITPILGLALLVMPMLHALIDYPAQIPGYSILLTSWLGFLFARHLRFRPPAGQADG